MHAIKKDAFTIMEILVVVFIIGLLATLVGPRVVELMTKGKVTATKATLTSIKGALTEYNMDIGHFPSKKYGLQALVEDVEGLGVKKWKGPYLSGREEVPEDGWGFEFVYNKPPEHFKKRYKNFEIISHGSEGEDSPKDEWFVDGA